MTRQVLDDTPPQLGGNSSGHSAWLAISIDGGWPLHRRLRAIDGIIRLLIPAQKTTGVGGNQAGISTSWYPFSFSPLIVFFS